MYVIRTIIGWLIGVIVLVLVADISVSNSHEITFYLWPLGALATMPLWLIAVGCFSVGLILGGLFLLPKLIMSRLRVGHLSRQLARMESQQNALSHKKGPKNNENND